MILGKKPLACQPCTLFAAGFAAGFTAGFTAARFLVPTAFLVTCNSTTSPKPKRLAR
jgi:hypothetical protein